MAETDDRTQAPSERRLQRAREEGQAPLSRELTSAAGLGAAALVLVLAGPDLTGALARRLRTLMDASVLPGDALARAAGAWAAAALPLLCAVGVAGAAVVMLQSGFLIHGKAAMPNLARLDPRRGLKRVFGFDNLVEALKAIVKLAILGWAVWSACSAVWPTLPGATNWTTPGLLDRMLRELVHLLLVVLGLQCFIALLDVGWTRWRHGQRLRMSREDLKQEHRESEGDPKVKARLKQLRAARARRRMLKAVGEATVVITNPTHYAVALSYERGGSSAPRVVAKGMDDVAARIRAAAEKAGVPLVANPPLARALYAIPLDSEVPAEHFRMVAEVIAYVWRLKERRAGAR